MVSNPPSSAQMMDMLVSRHGRFKLGRRKLGESWGESWVNVGRKLGESWDKAGRKLGRKLGRNLGKKLRRKLVIEFCNKDQVLFLQAWQFCLEHSSSYELSFFLIKSSLNVSTSASDFREM